MPMTRLFLSFAILPLFASCSPEESTDYAKAAKASANASTVDANAETGNANAPTGDATEPTGNANAATGDAKVPAATPGAKVLETMDSGGYTYVHLDDGVKQDWFAVPQCVVKVGDRVTVAPGGVPMPNFESKTLKRTFDVIYFSGGLQKVGAADAASEAEQNAAIVQKAHADATKNAPPADVEVEAIQKADGGMTVAEIWAQGAAGAGKDVALRGKVVKYNSGILGKNWLHVRDGSGTEGSNDITVTTDGQAKEGDIVLVTGKIVADKDFGAGYIYALLIEDAKVTVE